MITFDLLEKKGSETHFQKIFVKVSLLGLFGLGVLKGRKGTLSIVLGLYFPYISDVCSLYIIV